MARIAIYNLDTSKLSRTVVDETRDAGQVAAIHIVDGESYIEIPDDLLVDPSFTIQSTIQDIITTRVGDL